MIKIPGINFFAKFLIFTLLALAFAPLSVKAVITSANLHQRQFCQQAQVKTAIYNPDQGVLNIELWDPITPNLASDTRAGNLIIQKVGGNNIPNITSSQSTTTTGGFGFVFQVPNNSFNQSFPHGTNDHFDTTLKMDIAFKPEANTNNQSASCSQAITQNASIQIAAQPQQPATGGGAGGAAAPAGGVSSGNALDGLKSIISSDKQVLKFGTLGGLISQLLNVVFLIAGFLMFIWATVGIFQYITAGGNKEGLAKARARITWAMVGFLFVMISYLLSTYVQQIFKPNNSIIVPNVSEPK